MNIKRDKKINQIPFWIIIMFALSCAISKRYYQIMKPT